MQQVETTTTRTDDAPADASRQVRCAFSGELRSADGVLEYGEAHVAPEYGDAFAAKVLEDGGGRMDSEFAGVKRRSLGFVIDYLVKLIPITLVHIPYFLAAAKISSNLDPTRPGDLTSLIGGGFLVAWMIGKVGQLLISGGYEIWMVGRYGATLGKMAIGARVLSADRTPVGYARATLRWAAKTLLNGVIIWAVLTVPIVLVAAIIAFSVGQGGDVASMIPLAVWGALAVAVVFFPLSLFPYWMAATDPERRALHDRVASTRVMNVGGEEAAR